VFFLWGLILGMFAMDQIETDILQCIRESGFECNDSYGKTKHGRTLFHKALEPQSGQQM
jgi:hypothetical protein